MTSRASQEYLTVILEITHFILCYFSNIILTDTSCNNNDNDNDNNDHGCTFPIRVSLMFSAGGELVFTGGQNYLYQTSSSPRGRGGGILLRILDSGVP